MKKNVLAMSFAVVFVIVLSALIIILVPAPNDHPETTETAPDNTDYSNFDTVTLIEYKNADESVADAVERWLSDFKIEKNIEGSADIVVWGYDFTEVLGILREGFDQKKELIDALKVENGIIEMSAGFFYEVRKILYSAAPENMFSFQPEIFSKTVIYALR